jgi:RNA polymerase sigma factor (sigma-70 family)
VSKKRELPQGPPGERDPESYEEFWKIWKLHASYLSGLCLRWTRGNSADAEDALSQAKTKALAAYLKGRETLLDERAWLGRVLYTVCMDQYRQKSRREVLLAPGLQEALEGLPVRSSGPSPEDRLLRHELSGQLGRLAGELPSSWYSALVERVVHEKPYPDIAAAHGTTEVNIRKRVQLARAYLRRRLSDS